MSEAFVQLADGTVYHAGATPRRPMTDAEIDAAWEAHLDYRANGPQPKARRRPRRDSNYVVYEAVLGNQNYVGVTRQGRGAAKAAVTRRWRKHLSRARREGRTWALYTLLRQTGPEGWQVRVLAVVRGRAAAYAREQRLIESLLPTLNEQYAQWPFPG